MPEFKSLKELENYLNKQMRDVLQNEVAEVVKQKESESIDKNVYQAYSPSSSNGKPFVYERRRENGGLQDKKNMKSKVKNIGNQGVELSVENVTKGKDDNFRLDTLIEYGDGTDGKEYDYKENRDNTADQYLRARPFTSETVNELQQSNEHIHAFKNGMKSRGITFE